MTNNRSEQLPGIRRITRESALAEFQLQDVESQRDYATICPTCGTVQSMTSLVRAGADPATVEKFFGFSCEGRFSNAGPWPASQDKSPAAQARRLVRGCNWSLGGLFSIHTLEVIQPDGKAASSFEIASRAQTRELYELMNSQKEVA